MSNHHLWAPWRMQYISKLSDNEKPACFLCEAWADASKDRERLVVHRSDVGMIIMNRYPYTGGHLMVAPAEHIGDLDELSAAQRCDLFELAVFAERLIKTALNPQGINVGINIGRCSGAGLPGHVHVHLVPRWGGDTNFITVVGEVRVIPQALEATYDQMLAVLPRVRNMADV